MGWHSLTRGALRYCESTIPDISWQGDSDQWNVLQRSVVGEWRSDSDPPMSQLWEIPFTRGNFASWVPRAAYVQSGSDHASVPSWYDSKLR